MPFPFTCPHCGNFSQVADHLAGSVVPCLACGDSVELRAPLPEPVAETANADPAGLVFANEPERTEPSVVQVSKGAGAKKRSKGLKIKIAIAGVIAHVVVISVGVWLLIWQSSGPAETPTTKPVAQSRTHPITGPAHTEKESTIRVKDEYATIVLENLPEDAEVFVDNTPKPKAKGNKTEDFRVTAGKQHEIRVKKDGFEDFVHLVQKIDADERKNIAVDLKPLTSRVGANPPSDSGFSPLFNKSSHPDWRIVDGILRHFGPPASSTLLTSKNDYKDFILRLEVRLTKPGGKSFVIFRGAPQGFYLVRIDDQRTGQFCWAPPNVKNGNVLCEGTAQPLDQWFKLEIRADGNRFGIFHNGLANSVDDKNAAEGGQIGLYVDNQSVEFRNIEIKVLATAIAAAPKEPPAAAKLDPGEAPHLTDKFGVGFPSRASFRRAGLRAAGGGNQASEDAVAHGLKWLAKQQHNGGLLDPLRGSWECDGTTKTRVAATGIAVLAFLAAGHTDRADPGGPDYRQIVQNGVGYLVRIMNAEGHFGTQNMYEHAIATMAICEFYSMTKEPKLHKYCQAAVDFMIKAQHSAGGWRYGPGQAGDTSVTGWQIQALRSAHLAGLKVPEGTIQKAMAFLDSVQTGQTVLGSAYGYTDRNTGTPATTAVGLLCRQYLGWSQKNPAILAGIEELKKRPPPNPADDRNLDIYALYYATQVIHNYGGPDWQKFWNPRMRDLLVKWQVGTSHPQNGGSWDPNTDPNDVTAKSGGRLFTTCLALLSLEVYYRYSPIYKNENLKDPEIKEEVAKPTEVPNTPKESPAKPTEVAKAPKDAVAEEKEAARTLDFALSRIASADNLNSKSQYDNATKKYESAIEDLKEVVAKYAESEAAKKAREELKKLKEQFEKVYKDRPNTDGGRQAGDLLKKLPKGD
jgi:hypothetical protein